ncbi:MAG: TetR family transcriptional regulator [Hyphococcus sp.]|nr:MAG: TetR family transcriptional regulator [Marinicaulis sp.]
MAGKIKTRDRILQTALALFNEEGEAQVSTVDIAGVMEISPGNLYYHFRGKEAIIEALFDNFEEEIRQVLSAPIKRPLAIDDNWIFIYIIFEEINDFRFFYYGLASILERCPDLRPRMTRLLKLKQETSNAILRSLEKENFVLFAHGERDALAARLAAHMTFWLQYRDLTAPLKSGREIINDGVYTTMMQIAPYVRGDNEAYVELLSEYGKGQKS